MRGALAVEDPRRAGERRVVEAGGLHHRALGGQRALEDRQPAGLVDRPVERAEHVVVEARGCELLEVLGHRLPGDGQRVAVHQPGVEQRLHHDRDAADLVDVVHHVAAERLEVAEVRDLVADPVEVVDGQVDVGLAGHRQQVEHGVRGAAEGHHDGDRVLERLRVMTWRAVMPWRSRLTTASPERWAKPSRRRSTAGGAAEPGQAHPDRLGDGGHGVGGVHAAAGALARADRALDPVDLLAGDLPGQAGADGLEGVDDRDVVAVDLAGHDRAGVQEDAGQVEPRGGHHHAGQALVAAGQQHRAVEPLGHHHGLDRVGDHLAARPARSASPRGPSRCRRRPRSCRTPAGSRRPRARRSSPPGPGAASERLQGVISFQLEATPICGLAKSVVAHADGAEHAAGGGLLEPVGDVARAGLEVRRTHARQPSDGRRPVSPPVSHPPRRTCASDDGGPHDADVGQVLVDLGPGLARRRVRPRRRRCGRRSRARACRGCRRTSRRASPRRSSRRAARRRRAAPSARRRSVERQTRACPSTGQRAPASMIGNA